MPFQPIYLASASPRRHDLLNSIQITHEVLNVPSPPGEDEPRLEQEAVLDYVRRTARDKLLRALEWRAQNDEVASSFGWRRHPISGRHALHEGLDFPAPKGTPIYAASGGVVSEARYMTGYGKLVEINHGNGMSTRYAHASSIVVKLGDVVEKGQLIARVGSTGQSTGSHLHFEVRMAGHALDPKLFLPAREYVEQQVAQLDSDK